MQQYLLQSSRSELATRVVRAMHWLRVARNEASLHRGLLFRWFAIEAIWKTDAKKDIVPFIMWALGFPRGESARHVRREVIAALQSHSSYASWGRQIQQRLEEIRDLRNDSVHSGFREQDVVATKLEMYEHLMTLATSRVLYQAERALSLGAVSREELGDHLATVFEATPNLVGDVHHTVIYSLEHPHYSR